MDVRSWERHHHGQEEDILLYLPCDWRFLPKLGPQRLQARGPFLF
jgi:hypothetical protein